MEPVYLRSGVYLIGIISGPSVREIDDERMVERLRGQALQRWIDEEWDLQDVELSFDSEDYRWVIDHVRDNLPALDQ